jgi:glycosyltransferase involved in cell wall biosynthesis
MTPVPRLNVLHVSRQSQGGGADKVALALVMGLQGRGHRAWLAVAVRDSDDPQVIAIPDPRASPSARWARWARHTLAPLDGKVPGAALATAALRGIESPSRIVDWWQGREHFDYPGTALLPTLAPYPPDILHCHNFHGGYFDLRQLAPISNVVPVALTLHDEWSFTGHCAYTIGCERWRMGCGSCPDLTIYPALRHDATAANWLVKRAIYARSRVYVSSPSRWLLDRARDSTLAVGAAGWRHIPNGVDRSVFHPGDRNAARRALGLPTESVVLLFAANRARTSVFKDYSTVWEAARRIAERLSGAPLLLIALGEEGPTERLGHHELRFVPYEPDERVVAKYYQAADLYLHAARADNFPTSIVEALATGLPVVATAVGGIPEQVRSLAGAAGTWNGESSFRDRATGVLVDAGSSEAMASAALTLIRDESLRARLSANAALDAAERFDRETQLNATIAWYHEVVNEYAVRNASGHVRKGPHPFD